MCGIAAIFAYSADAPGVDRDELIAIRDRMTARGPDGCGEWSSPDGRVGLAHRRLSIIDLSEAGAQPMWNAERALCVVFNGEIYNHQALRSRLTAQGFQFRSNSDTEVLLHLYAQKGADMVHELRGMFAFAIWDNRKRTLFLARDPFGIKPLYYADDGRTIRAASQVKALLKSKHIDTSPEPAGHVGFFLWGHVPDPFTMYKGIVALPAGHTLTIPASCSALPAPCSFCSIPDILRSHANSNACSLLPAQRSELLRSALADSVSHHLIADVPVGVFQSAGLDSSTVTALVSEVHPKVRTVTLGFNEYRGTESDEVPLAEIVARTYATDHQTVWVSRSDFEAGTEALFDAMDHPSLDGVNTYFVSKAARESGLKVALSGLGGDELFGGYPSFQDVPRLARLCRPFASVPALGWGFRVLTAPVLKRFVSPKYAGIFEYGSSYGGAYFLRRGLFMPWELPEFLDPDLVREGWRRLNTLALLNQTSDLLPLRLDRGLPSSHPMERGAVGMVGGMSNSEITASQRFKISDRLRVSALELTWYMRHQLLRDSDWAGMAHSLEIRVPLVDIMLLRTLLPILGSTVPPTKRDMAATPRSPLPAAVLSRAKTGFTVPVREWLLASAPGSGLHAPRSEARGLRGWAHHVYSRFGGTGYTSARSRVAPRPPLRAARSDVSNSELRAFVLLTDGFGGHGGIAKFNRDFLIGLCSHAKVAEVIAMPRLAPEPIGTLPEKLKYPLNGLGGKARYFCAVINAARHLRQTARCDLSGAQAHRLIEPIIFCAHINLLPFAFLAHCIIRAPMILNLHGIEAWSRHRNPILVSMLRRVSAYVSVSEFTRERFLSWSRPGSQPFFILPNCVDLSAFGPGPRNPGLVKRHRLENRKVIMTLARLPGAERYKGIDEVMEVLPQLAVQVPNITYLICGDGDDRVRLQAKAATLGVKDRVVFVGRISETEKADYLRLADAFVMPGRGEGFGIVYLEALACGVPVIGSKLDGSRDALRNGQLGALVDPRNSGEIVSAVLDVLRPHGEPKDQSKVASGVEYFSFHRFQQRLHAIIDIIAPTWLHGTSSNSSPPQTGYPRPSDGIGVSGDASRGCGPVDLFASQLPEA